VLFAKINPLREHPYKSKFLFDRYKNELDKLGIKYQIVSGVGMEGLKNAIEIVDEII